MGGITLRILAVCALIWGAPAHAMESCWVLLSARHLTPGPARVGVVRRTDPAYDFDGFLRLMMREHNDPASVVEDLEGIEFYDRRDPRYRQRLIDLGFGLQGLNEIEECSHGLCASNIVVTDAGVRRVYSIIGIDTLGRSDKAIARTLAEELAHGKYNKTVEEFFRGKGALINENRRAMNLLNEFQAKYRAAREIKGALRSNTDILAELHQLYTEYAGGEDTFHEVIWFATKRTGKTIDDLTLNDVMSAAVSLDRKATSALTTSDHEQSREFRRLLRATVDTYRYNKDPWLPR